MDREDGGGRLVVRGRAVIDTRAPFKSVKEAVMLFGERVLVGEIYANKIKERASENESGESSQTRVGALREELEGTKQSLEKAKEENGLLAFCVQSLTEELERTKVELQKLKPTSQHQSHQLAPVLAPPLPLPIHPDVDEDLKFVESEKQSSSNNNNSEKGPTATTTFQKNKRYVKFASPPELDRVIVGKANEVGAAAQASSPPASLKRPKKKTTVVPLIGWLFAKRRGNQEP